MNQIWKFPLTGHKVTIEMPDPSKILTVQMQGNRPCIWAVVNPKDHLVWRQFISIGTGAEFKHDPSMIYLGTVQFGNLVFHIFENEDYVSPRS